MKISHSKRNKFKECPQRFDFYYNKKFRSISYGSPLFFGVALDEAFNVLLLQKKPIHNPEEIELFKKTPEQVFLDYIGTVSFNGQMVDIKSFEHTTYSKADFDITMLSEADFELIGHDKDFCIAHMNWYYVEVKKKESEVTEDDTLVYNLINWCSLKGKGLKILATYIDEIMPQIHEVHSIQEIVTLPNGQGDEITGVIDFTASFTDDPDTIYVIDNKTASKAYKDADLDESEQLHLYAYYKELDHIAFIVAEKNIRKRDPRVRINILKGTVDDNLTDTLLDSYSEVMEQIKGDEFKMDFSSGCNFWHKRCEYYSLCHSDKFDDKVLVCTKKMVT